MPDKIAIIGAGLVGRAWAISYARGGYRVALFDADAEGVGRAVETVRGLLTELEARDLLRGQSATDVAARLEPVPTLAEAVADAIHVQENVPERLETKVAVFEALDAAAPPEVTLASSTSALLPSSFTEGLAHRERCLVVHPINPPYLVPAVELVPAPWTDPAVMARTRALVEGIGQAPIEMSRELEGFVMNRMQAALLHEAFRLVADGYATTADVDNGIAKGLGLRWSFMGPFETIDLNAPGGVRDYAARYETLCQNIAREQRETRAWSGPLMDTVETQRTATLPRDGLAERQAWRDRRLMALAVHKSEMDTDIGT